MALNTEKNLKLYYSIKEVAEMIGVPECTLRFWEKEIPLLKPKTTGNNVRQYTDADIENVKAVYNLVKVRGFKLAAARKMLRENKQDVDNNARLMESLIRVRDELKEMKKHLDYLTSRRTERDEKTSRLPDMTPHRQPHGPIQSASC